MTGGRVIEFAKVDWEANAPRSIFFDDIYFSGEGAGEAKHVFLDGNDLARRFEHASRFTIGELGFGTGLNFLSAWALWRKVRSPGSRLSYLSVEKFPLHPDDLLRAAGAWPQFLAEASTLARVYPPAVAGLHQISLDDGVTFTLGFGDAADMLGAFEASVDAWFLDGFSPAKNPEMWDAAVFREVARLSAPGATAATFTVAGAVRRGLEASGFITEMRTGYGRKREMLTAVIARPPRTCRRAPWFAPAREIALAPGARLAVIGGGVAGASLANAAQRAGLEATVIDPQGLATGASGNVVGLIMPRFDLGDGASARFFIAAYLHALRSLARLDGDGSAGLFNPCGVFQPSLTADDAQWAEKVLASGVLPDGFTQARDGGLFFLHAGVVNPPAYVAALARGAAMIRAEALAIESSDGGARVKLDDGRVIDADAVVIANGADALRFEQARCLPLSRVAGQIDHFPDAAAPPSAVAFGPYVAPSPEGGLVIGATYAPLDARAKPATSLDATRSTIAAIAKALPDLAALLRPEKSLPRASVRCQTPDRLPIAGPAPDIHFYGAHYDDLRFGKKRDYPAGRLIPRVFLLTGLGSRGLVTAPLLAEMIVAEMTGAPSPVGAPIAEALHPARFFIRDLKRAVVRRAK